MKESPTMWIAGLFSYPKKKLLRNFLIYQVWGRAPIPPPSGFTPKCFHTFGKKNYICNTQRQPAERYGRVAKNKLPGRIDGVPTSLAAFFFLSYWYDYKVSFFGWSTLYICTQAQMPATRAARPNTDKNTINSTIPLFKFLRQLYIPPPVPQGGSTQRQTMPSLNGVLLGFKHIIHRTFAETLPVTFLSHWNSNFLFSFSNVLYPQSVFGQ